MKNFNFEVGKQFLLRNGITATVVDIDFGGLILLKYYWFGVWKTLKVNKNGVADSGIIRPEYDVVSAKPVEFRLQRFVVLCLEDGKLKLWSVYDTKPSQEDIEGCKIAMGPSCCFYGVQKVVYKSDGTKDKINF